MNRAKTEERSKIKGKIFADNSLTYLNDCQEILVLKAKYKSARDILVLPTNIIKKWLWAVASIHNKGQSHSN